ncbi:IS3 family transposase [Streptomyces sp. NPDC090106]|uniref:IS3 family transposase n=1 Tax=Streptomyces sp. NPDC090106 TaxID=3365946 RepID=UPI00380C6163
MEEEFDSPGGTYGSPKIWGSLVRQGRRVSVNTIAKIMSEFGLIARKVSRRRGLTWPGKRPVAPDFVQRHFTAEAPDLVRGDDGDRDRRGQALSGHGHRPVLLPSDRVCERCPS